MRSPSSTAPPLITLQQLVDLFQCTIKVVGS
ncbi:hypothetical protein HaLaN_16543 [Haematococcus lacustris]|uniref:Uncharacterized protein n=1 Tax=Haematococcus lacustris TaxID=44745 RepID=A0A699ZM30_HAELA|nr:hypothetical protein HaLaN_16543 [Haematococcus lacustris]